MDTNLPAEQDKQYIRLEYNTPILEEYGDLHKLTHGGETGAKSEGGGLYYDPV